MKLLKFWTRFIAVMVAMFGDVIVVLIILCTLGRSVSFCPPLVMLMLIMAMMLGSEWGEGKHL